MLDFIIEEICYFRFRANLTLTSTYNPKIFNRLDFVLGKLCKVNRRILIPQTLLAEILQIGTSTLAKFAAQNNYTFDRHSNIKEALYYTPYDMEVMKNLVNALCEFNLSEFVGNLPIQTKNFTQLLKCQYCPTHLEITKICVELLQDPAGVLEIYPFWTTPQWQEKDQLWIATILNQLSKLEGLTYE